MMKNKFSSIKNTLLFVLVSLLIIAIGVGVPFMLLALKTKPSNLPSGKVDVKNIQPYGADTIRMEKSLIEAVDTYMENSQVFKNTTSTWVATKENAFEEIGIQSRLYNEGFSRQAEFINELDDIIITSLGESGFGSAVIVSSTEDLNTDHLLYKISAQDNTTVVILDGETGIPVYSQVTVITSNSLNRSALRSQIIRLYQDYADLDFVYHTSDPGTFDNYDSFYMYEIENTDHSIKLTIVITSGWYWLPPDSNSEDWKPTDKYIWTINVYCNDSDQA